MDFSKLYIIMITLLYGLFREGYRSYARSSQLHQDLISSTDIYNRALVNILASQNMDQRIEKEKPAPLKIIICGGGIAGFAAALLLREEHDVLVLESSSSNEELGAAITLSINATRLLRRSFARAGFDKDLANYVEAEKVEGNPTRLTLVTLYNLLTPSSSRSSIGRTSQSSWNGQLVQSRRNTARRGGISLARMSMQNSNVLHSL